MLRIFFVLFSSLLISFALFAGEYSYGKSPQAPVDYRAPADLPAEFQKDSQVCQKLSDLISNQNTSGDQNSDQFKELTGILFLQLLWQVEFHPIPYDAQVSMYEPYLNAWLDVVKNKTYRTSLELVHWNRTLKVGIVPTYETTTTRIPQRVQMIETIDSSSYSIHFGFIGAAFLTDAADITALKSN